MKLSLLGQFVRHSLTEAYSQGLVNSLVKKFKSENPALTDNAILYYVQKFDENKDGKVIKSSPKSNDILKYTWAELEKLIDANFSTRSLYEPVIEIDMDQLYQSEDGTLQIFLGDRREKCIKIRQDFEGRTRQQYSWCISRSGVSNMFASYRFRAGEPVFYYVFDTDRDLSDPLHACVIYVDKEEKFFLSDSRNQADKRVTWDQIVTMMPKLRDLRQIFEHKPLSPREREVYTKIEKKLNDEQFAALTRDEKEEYIGFGHKLTEAQIRDIFSIDRDLVNKYCNMNQRVKIPLDIYKKLPPATQRVIKDGWKEAAETFEFLYEGKREIEGNLMLTGTPITSLPEGLEVGGGLYLGRTPITSLPEGLKVGGNLDLAVTPITSLPPGLEVGGNLNLSNTKITSLPEDLKVGGNLNLQDTEIASLPEGLEVGGGLDLTGTPITSLPPGLKVGENLFLRFTEIASLPEDLAVGGELNPPEYDRMYREMKRRRVQAESTLRSFVKLVLS